MLRVLVVTLYSGENEFEECLNSVRSQVGAKCDHKVIKNLPKHEAHQKLYKLFNDSRQSYDFMVKLDADMAFATEKSLTNLLEFFDDGIEVVSATVLDGLTGMDMDAIHIYTNRCFFHYDSGDPLFTDQVKIEFPGRKLKIVDHDHNVMHAFDPSEFQSFMFGVHRAMKVMQHGFMVPKLNYSSHQRKIISRCFSRYKSGDFDVSKYAILGAGLVYDGVIKDSALYAKDDYRALFEDRRGESKYLDDKRFKSESLLTLSSVIGIVRFTLAAFSYAFRRMKMTILPDRWANRMSRNL